MRHRSPARWLAPLALVTCAVAAYAIVHSGSTSGDGGGTVSVTSTRAKTTSGGTTTKTKAAKGPSTYTVKSGDVLSAIAAAHGTTVQQLQALNPSVDAATLHVGQKIRLRR